VPCIYRRTENHRHPTSSLLFRCVPTATSPSSNSQIVYHPDKVRANASINLALAAQVWQQLNECKLHLFDEVRRKFYDMKIGHSKPTAALVRNLFLVRLSR
jgi:hypothetical protein